MDLSFVMLTWNSADTIGACLDSIIDSQKKMGCEYEIHIVDNGSTDDTRKIISHYQKECSPHIEVEYLSRNMGTTLPRNLALRKAQGKHIVILDSDVMVCDKTLTLLVDELESDEFAGIVVPRLVYSSGHFQKSTDDFPTLISKIRRFLFLKQMQERDDPGAESIYVDYAISAFWVMRASLLGTVGYFDENIFYAPEDVDYCLACWKAGYAVKYCPAAVAVHDAQELSRGLRLNRAKIEHVKGLLYYFRKHHYLFNVPSVRH